MDLLTWWYQWHNLSGIDHELAERARQEQDRQDALATVAARITLLELQLEGLERRAGILDQEAGDDDDAE